MNQAHWTEIEHRAAQALLELAWQEDLDQKGDVTSRTLISETLQGKAAFVARQDGVLSGLPILDLVFDSKENPIGIQRNAADGDVIKQGQRLAQLRGPLRAILTGERIALNFLQHLSGIATQTRKYVAAIQGTNCTLLDTRKTLPGWRILEKYAVRCGGGTNHRMGLFDAVLIKDNHLAGLRHVGTPITVAVQKAQNDSPSDMNIEVEVDRLQQLEEVLPLHPHRILLDNMNVAMLKKSVELRNRLGPSVKLEASGGITLANIRAVAETGVDFISCGALTHSATALDIALDYED